MKKSNKDNEIGSQDNLTDLSFFDDVLKTDLNNSTVGLGSNSCKIIYKDFKE